MSKKKIVCVFTMGEVSDYNACSEEIENFEDYMEGKIGRRVDVDEPINYMHILDQRGATWKVHLAWLVGHMPSFHTSGMLDVMRKKYLKFYNDGCPCSECFVERIILKNTKKSIVELFRKHTNQVVGNPRKAK